MANELKETVTVTREVTGVRRDLVFFVKRLVERGVATLAPGTTDQQLLGHADDFWDSQHGED